MTHAHHPVFFLLAERKELSPFDYKTLQAMEIMSSIWGMGNARVRK